jgi:hypothetical protein
MEPKQGYNLADKMLDRWSQLGKRRDFKRWRIEQKILSILAQIGILTASFFLPLIA